jgi:uroporphyrinogen decarboxylase
MTNDRELLKTVKERKRADRLLYYAKFTPACFEKITAKYGYTNQEEFMRDMGFFVPEQLITPKKPDAPEFDYSEYYKDVTIPDGVKISPDGVLRMPGSTHHFVHLISPLRNIYDFDEIKKFPVSNRKEYYDFSSYKRQVEEIHGRGHAAQVRLRSFFETSWPIRGYENMLADMLAEPETAEYFLNIESEYNLASAEAAARAGADMVFFGDDVGTQKAMIFSADLWREMYKPLFAKLFNSVKKIKPDIVIRYHSCGHITEIIPDLIEVGLDILNPIQPECMDIWDIHKKYGDKLSFDGGLGTQTTVPFGTPQEIDEAVKKLVDVFGANGGIILAPTHILEPEVPIENIEAYINAAQKYCRGINAPGYKKLE